MDKVKRTYMLEEQTVKKIERLASQTRRSRGAIIDLALEAYDREYEDDTHQREEEGIETLSQM